MIFFYKLIDICINSQEYGLGENKKVARADIENNFD